MPHKIYRPRQGEWTNIKMRNNNAIDKYKAINYKCEMLTYTQNLLFLPQNGEGKTKKKESPTDSTRVGKPKEMGKLKTQQKYKPQLVIKLVKFSQQTFTLTTRPTRTHKHTQKYYQDLHSSSLATHKDFKRPIEA